MEPVIFYSPIKEGRPIRCSEQTRRFAKTSLDGTYGREALTHMFASLPASVGTMDARSQYDAAILAIAEQAPLRLVEGSYFCGSATFGAAIQHVVPASLDGVNPICGSISHLTCNFEKVVKEGLDATRDRILAKQKEEGLDAVQRAVLASMLHAYDALKLWHGRYLAMLLEKRDAASDAEEAVFLSRLYDTLTHVPFAPAKTFREGLQAVWFTFAFVRLCGNWPGIGRLDKMLEPLYQADLAAGRITEAEAREFIAHFMIMGCEWVNLQSRGSGDAQHYQNLVLGGCDETGVDRTGVVTRLILEVVEELPIADFPIAVRVSKQSPAWLTRKMAEVIRHGSGVVAMYNEELIIDSLVRFHYPVEEARKFANDGCWEVQIPGKTRFGYTPMDLYGAFERDVLHLQDDVAVDYADFESMYQAFRTVMGRILHNFHAGADHCFCDIPSGVIDLLEDGCIEHAKAYYNGGPVYNVSSPHFGGIPDTANAMYAIKKLVFEEKRIEFPAFMQVLKNNWEGDEVLRQYIRSHYSYYGNDNDAVDFIAARIVHDFCEDCRMVKLRNEVLRPPGISTFGRQIEWKDVRTASAHGFRRGDILSGNISPTPSTDRAGATAIIRSACKTDFSDLTCGTVLDIKLDPKCVEGEEGLTAIEGLLQGFHALGGFFIQLDVIDQAVLLDAQKHPENHQNLAVRISGWSARFVTLDETWQQMIIERTGQNF